MTMRYIGSSGFMRNSVKYSTAEHGGDMIPCDGMDPEVTTQSIARTPRRISSRMVANTALTTNESSGFDLNKAIQKYRLDIAEFFLPVSSEEEQLEDLRQIQPNYRNIVLQLVPILKQKESPARQFELFNHYATKAVPGQLRNFLPILAGLDIGKAIWADQKVAKSLLSNPKITEAIGAERLAELIHEGLDGSQKNAVAALSRSAVIDTLSGQDVVNLLTSARAIFPIETAHVLSSRAVKLNNKVGPDVMENNFYSEYSNTYLMPSEVRGKVWKSFCAASPQIKSSPQHLPLAYTAG